MQDVFCQANRLDDGVAFGEAAGHRHPEVVESQASGVVVRADVEARAASGRDECCGEGGTGSRCGGDPQVGDDRVRLDRQAPHLGVQFDPDRADLLDRGVSWSRAGPSQRFEEMGARRAARTIVVGSRCAEVRWVGWCLFRLLRRA